MRSDLAFRARKPVCSGGNRPARGHWYRLAQGWWTCRPGGNRDWPRQALTDVEWDVRALALGAQAGYGAAALFHRPVSQLLSISKSESAQHGLDVAAHGGPTNAEPLGDFSVGEVLGQQARNRLLSLGQCSRHT